MMRAAIERAQPARRQGDFLSGSQNRDGIASKVTYFGLL
jgi:hypothetical protein